MNSNVVANRVQIDQSIVASVREVKETIAVPFKNKPRRFGILDMWNIRRNAKSASASLRF